MPTFGNNMFSGGITFKNTQPNGFVPLNNTNSNFGFSNPNTTNPTNSISFSQYQPIISTQSGVVTPSSTGNQSSSNNQYSVTPDNSSVATGGYTATPPIQTSGSGSYMPWGSSQMSFFSSLLSNPQFASMLGFGRTPSEQAFYQQAPDLLTRLGNLQSQLSTAQVPSQTQAAIDAMINQTTGQLNSMNPYDYYNQNPSLQNVGITQSQLDQTVNRAREPIANTLASLLLSKSAMGQQQQRQVQLLQAQTDAAQFQYNLAQSLSQLGAQGEKLPEGVGAAILQQFLAPNAQNYQIINNPLTGQPSWRYNVATNQIEPLNFGTGGFPTGNLPSGSQPTQNQAALTVSKILGVQPTTATSTVPITDLASAIAQNEGFTNGTSTVAVQNNNPGNLKFAGQPGATQGSPAPDGGYYAKFASVQDGYKALQNDISAKVNSGKYPTLNDFFNTYSPNTTDTSGQQKDYGILNNYVDPTFSKLGVPFIDISKLNSNEKTIVEYLARQPGIKIPLLDQEEVQAVREIQRSLSNLNTITSTFSNLASQGIGGALFSNISDPISSILQTDYGKQLNAYNQNRDSLFQQINALAGSHPRINTQELGIAANALPTLSEFSKDTLQQGLNKVALTKQYLDNALQTYLPSYNGSLGPQNLQSGGQTQQIGGATFKINPDGSATRIQ